MPTTGHEYISLNAGMSGCAEKHATSIASNIVPVCGFAARARIHASAERIASVVDSMAEGPGRGAVKPVSVQFGGSDERRVSLHPAVIEGEELGFMRRIEMLDSAWPWMGVIKGDGWVSLPFSIVVSTV